MLANDWNTLHRFFEFALKLATERGPLLLDTSVLYALYSRNRRDANIRERLIDLLRGSDRVYAPDLALLELREIALSRNRSRLETVKLHLEANKFVQTLFKHVYEVIFPLGVGKIEVVAVEPDDLAYDPILRFYDATILTMGARRDFYVVTAERNLRYFSFAMRISAKVVNDCLWHLAKYYIDRIAERYVKSKEPALIMKWINERDYRIRKWEERYGECVRTEVETL